MWIEEKRIANKSKVSTRCAEDSDKSRRAKLDLRTKGDQPKKHRQGRIPLGFMEPQS